MLRRLDTHVVVILLVFAIVGAILAIIELLGVVLACCMASQYAHEEEMERDDWGYEDYPVGGGGGAGIQHQRPNTPQTVMSQDISSHHETAF